MKQTKSYSILCLIIAIQLLLSLNCFADQHIRYEIKASVDAREKTVSAVERVVMVNNSGKSLNDLYFHVYPNRKYTEKEKAFMMEYASYFRVDPFPSGFQSTAMDIRSIRAGGEEVSFAIEGDDQTLLRVSLKEPLSPGESADITIDFKITIPHAYGRLGWIDHTIALSRWYPMLSVLDERGWDKNPFYPFHRPFFSESAEYSVELSVPEDQVVIHSGNLKATTEHDDKTKTLKIESSQPLREFTLALSPDYRVFEENFDGILIKAFYLPGGEFHARQVLQSAKDMMKFYGGKFGKYPYEQFSIAPVYLGYGGEQMSNMIFIDTRVYQLPRFLERYLDFLVAHETGHQWFYNLVGVDEFTHMWMEEGVNSYFLLEYLENKYGKDAAILELPKPLSWLLPTFSFRDARDTRYKIIARTNWDRPIVGKLSSFSEPSSIFSLNYGKGSGVVAMLKYVMGEESFDRAFRRIFAEYRFKNLSQAELQKVCEEESGQKLGWFFTQWLNTAEKCDYAVESIKDNQITIVNRGGIVMPLEVQINYKDGTQQSMKVDGQEDRMVVQGKAGQPIQRVTIDPNENQLDIDRTNNSYPRKINTRLVPLYIGLYDIPVFLPDDGYNLVIGPEIANGIGVKASFQKPYDQHFYTATDYDFSEKLQHSRMGYVLNNLFHTQTKAGFELFNVNDLDDDNEDLAGGKVYVRKELWPAPYGISDINDHMTFYLLRDRSLGGDIALSGLEDTRNISYLKKDEAIIGTNFHFGRSGPYPDPSRGYELNWLVENSGHFLGATQAFTRSAADLSLYKPVTLQSKAAVRLKYGWGSSDDKNLFELGGINGLRGFDRKTIRGANGLLGSVEYRFPLINGLDWSVADHLLGLESIGAVAFFDAGQAWYDEFDDSSLRKDAGLGLRFMVTIGSFLEKAMLRVDAAKPIGDVEDKDIHYWVGVNQAF